MCSNLVTILSSLVNILGGNLYDRSRRKGIFTLINVNSEENEENGYVLKSHLLILY